MSLAPITMPQLGESVTEGTVERWLKHEGDLIERDEPLVEVVTDKVNAEIPSPFSGRLVKISVAEGQTVSAGVEIGQVEIEGMEGEASPPPSSTKEPHHSPAVLRLAEENGIDLTSIRGTGEGGRVTKEDVLGFLERREAREDLVPLSPMRRAIAEHMTRSLATSPHAWTMQEVDMTALVRYREAHKADFLASHGVPLTFLPFAIHALCDALREFPDLNSTWTEAGVARKRHYNIGLAVAVPDGLIVPVINDADRLGLVELAVAMADLSGRARAGQLRPDEVQGGTFTLNNTGATGSVASQPIINQPQAAILTTEAIVPRPVVIGEGIAIRHMMNMCMAFDHRIVDGMLAGSFLGWIKRRLEAGANQAE